MCVSYSPCQPPWKACPMSLFIIWILNKVWCDLCLKQRHVHYFLTFIPARVHSACQENRNIKCILTVIVVLSTCCRHIIIFWIVHIIIWLKYLFQEGFHLSNCQRLQWSNQSAWLNFVHFSVLNSQTQAFSSMRATHKQIWLIDTHPEATLQWLQFCSTPADDQFSVFSPVDRSVWVLHEFPFLFITLWCPAAPVNTFLQQAIHCNILAAETPVMNFNLPFAEGASPWVGLIKGNTPFQEGGRLQTDWAQVTP